MRHCRSRQEVRILTLALALPVGVALSGMTCCHSVAEHTLGKDGVECSSLVCYTFAMRKVLENLMERAVGWPEEAQAELVEAMLEIETRHGGVYRLSDEERDAVRRGLREFRDGKLASDEAVAAAFDRGTPDLADAIRRRFAKLGGLDLDLPPRSGRAS